MWSCYAGQARHAGAASLSCRALFTWIYKRLLPFIHFLLFHKIKLSFIYINLCKYKYFIYISKIYYFLNKLSSLISLLYLCMLCYTSLLHLLALEVISLRNPWALFITKSDRANEIDHTAKHLAIE